DQLPGGVDVAILRSAHDHGEALREGPGPAKRGSDGHPPLPVEVAPVVALPEGSPVAAEWAGLCLEARRDDHLARAVEVAPLAAAPPRGHPPGEPARPPQARPHCRPAGPVQVGPNGRAPGGMEVHRRLGGRFFDGLALWLMAGAQEHAAKYRAAESPS